MRWDDTEGGKTEFTGFHRIERFLWPPQPRRSVTSPARSRPTTPPTPRPGQRGGDRRDRRRPAQRRHALKDELGKSDFSFETRMFVAGLQALIDEVAATKVDGEEGPLLAHRPVGLRRQRRRLGDADRRTTADHRRQTRRSWTRSPSSSTVCAPRSTSSAKGDGCVIHQGDRRATQEFSNQIDALSASRRRCPVSFSTSSPTISSSTPWSVAVIRV